MSKVTLITKKTEVITLKTGSRGPQGVKGDKGNQWRGAYSGATAYVVDDVVSYLGSSYICILASTNNLPTNITFWSLFATTGTANASNVTNTPAGNISATNVQNALNELDTEKANITQEAWITPTLLNGWVNNAGFTSRYKKDSMGVVWVELFVNSGTNNSVIFTLPIGYRPLQSLVITGNASGSLSSIFVAPGGAITHNVGTTTSLHRYVFCFRTD